MSADNSQYVLNEGPVESGSRARGSVNSAGPDSPPSTGSLSASRLKRSWLTRAGSSGGSSGGSFLPTSSSRGFVAATGALTLVFFIWQVLWAILTPAFRAPDEPLHVNSVIRVAEGGGWPAPGEARLSSSVLQAVRESGMISADSQGFAAMERTRVVGSREAYPEIPRFGETAVTPHSQRIALNGKGWVADGGSVPSGEAGVSGGW